MVKCFYGKIGLQVPAGVYVPREDSVLAADYLAKVKAKKALDDFFLRFFGKTLLDEFARDAAGAESWNLQVARVGAVGLFEGRVDVFNGAVGAGNDHGIGCPLDGAR